MTFVTNAIAAAYQYLTQTSRYRSEGDQAYRDGSSIDMCPYKDTNDHRREDWMAGYYGKPQNAKDD